MKTKFVLSVSILFSFLILIFFTMDSIATTRYYAGEGYVYVHTNGPGFRDGDVQDGSIFIFDEDDNLVSAGILCENSTNTCFRIGGDGAWIDIGDVVGYDSGDYYGTISRVADN